MSAAPILPTQALPLNGSLPPPILQVSGLSKRFGGFVALADIELEVGRGLRLGLIGPNGSGKSTLVNCLCGTLRNESGSVRFEGKTLDGMAAHQRTRMGLARTFQLPRPFGTLTLAENLRIPILYAVHTRQVGGASDIDRRCMELLEMVGLAEKSTRLPKDLTQIEMRKLELARAMAADPRLLIADEAMAGLSHGEVDDILALLVRLNEEQGITIILIEHIMRAVLSFSQRLVVLVAGRKIADGDPRDVVRQDDVVAAYLGS
jgi:branched-chain amino acid transport system ATP-binding protein